MGWHPVAKQAVDRFHRAIDHAKHVARKVDDAVTHAARTAIHAELPMFQMLLDWIG